MSAKFITIALACLLLAFASAAIARAEDAGQKDTQVQDAQQNSAGQKNAVQKVETQKAAQQNAAPRQSPELQECTARGGLPNFAALVKKGGKATVAYLGGSVTSAEGYRVQSFDWLADSYPETAFTGVDASIGGTGVTFAAFRLERDVLTRKPDLIFVEFAVQDRETPPEKIVDALEGIIRHCWRVSPSTDICFLYALSEPMFAEYARGEMPVSVATMEIVALRYDIPSVALALESSRLIGAGKLALKGDKPALPDGTLVFSQDGTHPFGETGHAQYAQALARSLRLLLFAGEPKPHTVLEPLRKSNLENAAILPVSPDMLAGDWEKLDPKNELAAKFADRLPALYRLKPGASLTLTFKGDCVGFCDVIGPGSGRLALQVDDLSTQLVSRFDAYSTYDRMGFFLAAQDLPAGEHEVAAAVLGGKFDKSAILAKREGVTMDKPERYGKSDWYVGGVLVVGAAQP